REASRLKRMRSRPVWRCRFLSSRSPKRRASRRAIRTERERKTSQPSNGTVLPHRVQYVSLAAISPSKFLAQATDRDLTSIQEARTLAHKAHQAAAVLAELTQEQIDRIIDAMAAATKPLAEEFAKLAVEETTYGIVADKIQKNLFSSVQVYEFIRPMRTVGI